MSAAPVGYSGTPLPKKLGIKAGHRVLVDRAPAGFVHEVLGPLPDCAVLTRASPKQFNVIIAFRGSSAEYKRNLPTDINRIPKDGALWIAWPKKSSGVVTDLNENVIRDFALETGLVDVKVCAIDETWSGLKLVYRLKDR
jgi:hypothetical protein